LVVCGFKYLCKVTGCLSAFKQAPEKGLHQRSETLIDDKQDDESQYEQAKKADEYLEDFEYQPQGDQSGQKDKKRVFKQIVHKDGTCDHYTVI